MAELLSKDGNKVNIKVTAPATEVSRAYEQVWTGLMRDVRVPGFRPGKAPKSVVAKRVGSDYIEQEVRDRLVNAQLSQALQELQLNLIDANFDFGTLKDGQSFEFNVKGETYPEVTLGDWQSLKFTSQTPDISDDVLERTLSDLQERNATFESVDRPSEVSDMVMIEEPGEDGGSYPIYLDVAEEHVQQALIGKQKGDEVTITVPAHSHGEHEHPEHTVTVKVLDVRHKQRQELGDEFAKSLNFDSLERLRADLREELLRRAEQEGEMGRREELIEHLVSGMQVDVPQILISNRREAMMEEIKADLSRQGVRWGEYEAFMREQGKLEEFQKDLAKNAEIRVRRDLALEQLAEDLKVSISQAEFNQMMMVLAQQNGLTIQQMRNQLGENGFNNYYISLLRDRALAQAIAQLNSETVEAAASDTNKLGNSPATDENQEGEQAAEAQPAQENADSEQPAEQPSEGQPSEGQPNEG